MSNQENSLDEMQKIFREWRKLIIFGVIFLALFLFKPWVQIGPGQRGIVLIKQNR